MRDGSFDGDQCISDDGQSFGRAFTGIAELVVWTQLRALGLSGQRRLVAVCQFESVLSARWRLGDAHDVYECELRASDWCVLLAKRKLLDFAAERVCDARRDVSRRQHDVCDGELSGADGCVLFEQRLLLELV